MATVGGVRDHPPAAAEVRRAVTGLAPAWRLRAAAHLATPRHAVVGIDVRPTRTGWSFRGEHAPASIDGLCRLGAVTAHPGDVFLDPSGPPWTWLKPLRSGAHVVAFGAELIGLPTVLAEPEVPTAQITAVVEQLATGRIELPFVAGPVLAEAVGTLIVLRALLAPTWRD